MKVHSGNKSIEIAGWFCCLMASVIFMKYLVKCLISEIYENNTLLKSLMLTNALISIRIYFKMSFIQSSVSHDPSEIILICWFAAQETFLIIIINIENSCAS